MYNLRRTGRINISAVNYWFQQLDGARHPIRGEPDGGRTQGEENPKTASPETRRCLETHILRGCWSPGRI